MHSEITKVKRNLNRTDVKNSIALRMINVNAKWHGDDKDTLCNVNLTVLPGSFVAVVGQVGSGKSSLLQAILQELPLTSGSIESCGRINYISQQPWIFASSVRQNILFGQEMDKSRYAEVIRICQMESDLCSFPYGDSTAVGERGMNLSGGQRARINLARAIYKDADIYLLDDPLSAVDSHVSKRLIDECICGYLKVRIVNYFNNTQEFCNDFLNFLIKTATRDYNFIQKKTNLRTTLESWNFTLSLRTKRGFW